MSGIWFDQDSTNAFYNSPLGEMNPGYFDKVVDCAAGTQVSRYFMCPGGATTIFDGKYNEVYAKGFDLNKGPEQAAMCGSKNAWLYRFAHNLHSMLAEGIDPVQYIIDRARQKGMEAWISMRMNDIHCGEDDTSPIHCSFWKEHPEYRISDVPYENSLNFQHAEVRELVLNRALELIERYDADGLQLDWTRFPTFFPHGKGEDAAHLITEIVKKVSAEAKRKNIGFGVRVLGKIDICLQRGLDVVNWAQQGLIDYIVIAPFLMTTDFDLPVEEWKKSTEIPVIYGIEACVRAYPGAKGRLMTPEEIRAVASIALNRGADAVYLFNFFEQIQPSYPKMFKEIGSLDTLKGKDRTCRVTWHDNEMTIGEQDKMNRFPGWIEKWREDKQKNGNYPFVLPVLIAPGQSESFRIYAGHKLEDNAQARIYLESANKENAGIEILVNDSHQALPLDNNPREYDIDKQLRNGYNTFTIVNHGTNSIEVLDLQLKISCC